MDRIVEILTSPVWWSYAVAVLAVFVGMKFYIGKIINEDKAIEEERKKRQALKEQSVD